MWILSKPVDSAADTYASCVSRVRDPVLRARLDAAAPAVVRASADFDAAASRAMLHTISTGTFVPPDVTAKEMEKVYTQRMAKKGAPGRLIYERIFGSSPNGKCPLCAQRSVSTLDHHLPKAHYPALVVAPFNLIPACHDCNKAKKDTKPKSAEEVSLHPYYDNLGTERWLTARVIATRPAAVRFRLSAPVGWDQLLKDRVRAHFRVLGLNELYASEAAEELTSIRHQLIDLHAKGGSTKVRRELRRRANSAAAARPNSWRTATYQAWSDSNWFCDGGFAPA